MELILTFISWVIFAAMNLPGEAWWHHVIFGIIAVLANGIIQEGKVYGNSPAVNARSGNRRWRFSLRKSRKKRNKQDKGSAEPSDQ